MVPGPVAAIAGLVLSGFPTDRFCLRFLPSGSLARRILSLKGNKNRGNLWSTPQACTDLEGIICLARRKKHCACKELTKKFEDIARCTLSGQSKIWKWSTEGRICTSIEGASKGYYNGSCRKWSSISIKFMLVITWNKALTKRGDEKVMKKEYFEERFIKS